MMNVGKLNMISPCSTDLGERIMFTEFIQRCSNMYENDIKTQVHIGKKCKDCQFHNKNNSELKSGFNECWLAQTNLTETQLKEKTYLWKFGEEVVVVFI